MYITDKDECFTGEDACDQMCDNVPGSYTCSCAVGYTLDADMYSCNGE